MYFQNKTLAALTTLFVVNGSYASSSSFEFDGNGKQTGVRDLQTCEDCLVTSKIGETLSCVFPYSGTEYTVTCNNFAATGGTCTNGMYPDELTFDEMFYEVNADGEALYVGTHYIPTLGINLPFKYYVSFDPTIEEGVCDVTETTSWYIVSVGCTCIPSDSPSIVLSSSPSMMLQPSNDDVDENSSDDEGSDDNESVTSNDCCCCCDEKDIQNTLFSTIKDKLKLVGN